MQVYTSSKICEYGKKEWNVIEVIKILEIYDQYKVNEGKESIFRNKKILKIRLVPIRKACQVVVSIGNRSGKNGEKNVARNIRVYIKEVDNSYNEIYDLCSKIRKDKVNISHEYLIDYEGKNIVVSEDIKDEESKIRRCDFFKIRDVINATCEIRRLHEVSISKEEMKNFDNLKINRYGKMIDVFDKKIKDMYNFLYQIDLREDMTKFDIIYRENLNFMIDIAEKLKNELSASRYLEKTKEELDTDFIHLCHHDLEFHNILIKKNKINNNQNKSLDNDSINRDIEVFFIDFEYMILDLCHHDLASFIKRVIRVSEDLDEYFFDDLICKKKREKLYIIEAKIGIILKSYFMDDIKMDDWDIIRIIINFPEEFWQVGYQKYVENKTWSEDRFLRKLNKAIIVQRNKKYITFNNNDKYICDEFK